MPITRSARKAHRSSEKKQVFNLARKKKASEAMKSVKKLILSGNKKEAVTALRTAQKALDKAAKMGTLTKNAASRKKSRLARAIAKLG